MMEKSTRIFLVRGLDVTERPPQVRSGLTLAPAALDRSKGISAFSFGEFAIVKATDRQGTSKRSA